MPLYFCPNWTIYPKWLARYWSDQHLQSKPADLAGPYTQVSSQFLAKPTFGTGNQRTVDHDQHSASHLGIWFSWGRNIGAFARSSWIRFGEGLPNYTLHLFSVIITNKKKLEIIPKDVFQRFYWGNRVRLFRIWYCQQHVLISVIVYV